MKFTVGTKVRVWATMRDPDGALIDPDEVRFKYKGPTVSQVEHIYPSNITRVSLGVYWSEVTGTTAGSWSWRWSCSGNCVCAAEGFLTFSKSAFP